MTSSPDPQPSSSATRPRPVVLMILDGYGISFLQEGNAILAAEMKHMDEYLRAYPAASIQASGIEVGLPWGEVGNSETGHKNIGSGRIMYQPLPQITLAIRDRSFFENPAFVEAVNHMKDSPNAALHLMGCVSTGGVHSHLEHLIALLDVAHQRGVSDRTFVHAILDGRDTAPVSAGEYLTKVDAEIQRGKAGGISSIVGRHYAMDRNNNWDRTKAAYDLFVHGEGTHARSWKEALESAYEAGETDETVTPHVIVHKGQPLRTIQDGDAVIFFNFRPDRARQMTYAFVQKEFSEFDVQKWNNLDFVTMAEYQRGLPVTIAFPEEQAEYPLGRVISDAGLRQLRIAETEKYAHVTYYFNSGRELPYPGEDRILVPSPNVKDYVQTPEMSAAAITDRVVQEVEREKYDFIVMNYSNPDMISHTGDFHATVESLKFLDGQIHRVIEATLAANGVVLLTCDHGNAEELINHVTHEPTKDHSANPVPIIFISPSFRQDPLKSDDLLFQILSTPIGVLADVAPTCLEILGIPQPEQMTAQSLLKSLV